MNRIPPKKKNRTLLGGLLQTIGRAGIAGAQGYAMKNAPGQPRETGGCTPCAANARKQAAAAFVRGS